LIPLLFKKSFFDYWENFVPGLLVNASQFLLFGAYILATILTPLPWGLLILAGGQLASFVISYWYNLRLSAKGSRVPVTLSRALPGFFRLAVAQSCLLIAGVFSFTFYFTPQPSLSWALAILAFWLLLLWFLVLWLYPGVVLLGETQPLRKSLHYALKDFPRLMLLGIIALPIMASSVILLPGQAWVVSLGMNLARFYRLREQAQESGADTRWAVVLREVQAEVGGRTLRNLIFPWE
jgi:hypothetical protein